MKWVSLPPNIDRDDYNTSNHHDRDPYTIDDDTDELVIDAEWWHTQVPQRTKDLQQKRGINFALGKVSIPHEDQFDVRLIAVYQAYQEAFECQGWAEGRAIFCVTAAEKEAGIDWFAITERMDAFLNDVYGHNHVQLFVRTGALARKWGVPKDLTTYVARYYVFPNQVFTYRECGCHMMRLRTGTITVWVKNEHVKTLCTQDHVRVEECIHCNKPMRMEFGHRLCPRWLK